MIFLASPEEDYGKKENVTNKKEAARTFTIDLQQMFHFIDKGVKVFQNGDYFFKEDFKNY